jgi:ADP-heptose:LPS heptosyltransferase
MAEKQSEGWYLGLPYMLGTGLRAVAPGAIEPGAPSGFLFVDDVLAACPDWVASLHEWWAHLDEGAHLILWLPDCTKVEVRGHRFMLTLLDHALDDVDGWQQLECAEVGNHLFAVFRKVSSGQQRFAWKKQAKHLLVIRAGAYGDAVMASSILPLLKQQGWVVDVLTGEAGEMVLRHDPHITRLLTVQKNQVSDQDLPHFWQAHGARYDRVVNLTYSVEGELLKLPFRGDYFWPDEQRRAQCKRSYLARQHELAGVEAVFAPVFHASREEKEFARGFRLRHGPFILWCLRGSAVHKWYPHAPQVICRVLSHSNAVVVLSGGEDSRDLADNIHQAVKDYFGDTDRVVDLCGKHHLRRILALAKEAALVVGPETGVLNAVSFEKNRKLVFLSHSAPENLTNDWVNTEALVPKAPCYPCHRLHYGTEWCPQDEKTGAAVCAASISPDNVVKKVIENFRKVLFGASSSAVPATGDAQSTCPKDHAA